MSGLQTAVIHAELPHHHDRQSVNRSPDMALEEAVLLTEAISLEVALQEVVKITRPSAGYLFSKGHLERLKNDFSEAEIDIVVVNQDLTPIQQRNLERFWKVKVLDRTALILEIFGERAETSEGVLQVELAHLIYQKSRLVRSWTHLERQRGGVGFLGGPGETQIESDRRMLAEKINVIQKKLKQVVKTRSLHRDGRAKRDLPVIALVGYTNAGKSTLFNRLTDAGTLEKDMLFATLDPKMRKLNLPSGKEVVLSDTVGFISNLPTQLVASFRATLEEVRAADVILHVRDISHPETEAQAQDVAHVLSELDIDIEDEDEYSILEVWNKIDKIQIDKRDYSGRSKLSLVSAVTGEGIDGLLAKIDALMAEGFHTYQLNLPPEAGKARAWLFQNTKILSEMFEDGETQLEFEASDENVNKFNSLFREFSVAACKTVLE